MLMFNYIPYFDKVLCLNNNLRINKYLIKIKDLLSTLRSKTYACQNAFGVDPSQFFSQLFNLSFFEEFLENCIDFL